MIVVVVVVAEGSMVAGGVIVDDGVDVRLMVEEGFKIGDVVDCSEEVVRKESIPVL